MSRAYRLLLAHPLARALGFTVDLAGATADAVADLAGDVQDTARWVATLTRAAP